MLGSHNPALYVFVCLYVARTRASRFFRRVDPLLLLVLHQLAALVCRGFVLARVVASTNGGCRRCQPPLVVLVVPLVVSPTT